MIFATWDLCVFILKDHTQSQLYNCSIISTRNAAERTCPEAKSWQPHHWTAKP